MRVPLTILLLLTACAAPGTSQVSLLSTRTVSQYTATELPAKFIPVAIMNDGTVVGSIGQQAAIYHGTLKLLGSYKNELTFATAENSGTVVGYARDQSYKHWKALRFETGAITIIPNIPKCNSDTPTAISAAGAIYGTCWQPDENTTPSIARFTSPAGIVMLQGLPAQGYLYNVDPSGEFAGSQLLLAYNFTGFRGTGVAANSVNPYSPWSKADWINDSGTVAGSFSLGKAPSFKPIIAYTQDASYHVRRLPSLIGSDDMEPTGINAAGNMVGNAYDANDNAIRVFVYDGKMREITHKISPAGQYILLPGYSDAGEFVAESGPAYYRVSGPSP